MLFVDATIDNPEFNSQSKEALTTPVSGFGGACKLPPAFVKGVAALPGLRDAVNERAHQAAISQLVKVTKNDRRHLNGASPFLLMYPNRESCTSGVSYPLALPPLPLSSPPCYRSLTG